MADGPAVGKAMDDKTKASSRETQLRGVRVNRLFRERQLALHLRRSSFFQRLE